MSTAKPSDAHTSMSSTLQRRPGSTGRFPVVLCAWLFLLLLIPVRTSGAAPAVPLKDKDCLDCHADKGLKGTNTHGQVVSLLWQSKHARCARARVCGAKKTGIRPTGIL